MWKFESIYWNGELPLERFLTIQAKSAQFCSITISSVSLCYWVHYFRVAFEKMTSLRKYTPVSVWLFVVVEGIPMKWSCLRNVWWSTPSFGIWVVAVPSGSLFAGELCRVSCQPQQLEKIMMHVWYECSYSVKWSKIQLEFLISHFVVSFSWLFWPSQIYNYAKIKWYLNSSNYELYFTF